MSRQETGSADPGYEIRYVRGEQGGSDQIEAWLPGWLWWAVQAVQRVDGWLVLVDRAVAETAGVPKAARTAMEAADAEQAQIWVELLAALYLKAEARRVRQQSSRPGGASAASALGSTQSYCFTTAGSSEPAAVVDSAERRRIRWGARAMLWQASSLKAVRCCGRMLHNDAVGDPDDGQGVRIVRREVDGRMVAHYQGLMTCGSVWSCPRCSAVIAHTRSAEIGAAVRECYRQGGRVYLLTLTMRHSSGDRLADLWDAQFGLAVGVRYPQVDGAEGTVDRAQRAARGASGDDR